MPSRHPLNSSCYAGPAARFLAALLPESASGAGDEQGATYASDLEDGDAVWRSDSDSMAFPANAIALSEERRKPTQGAGPGRFKASATRAGDCVGKGNLAVTLTGFIAERLP